MQTLYDYENMVNARLNKMKEFAKPETLNTLDNQIQNLKGFIESLRTKYTTLVDQNNTF